MRLAKRLDALEQRAITITGDSKTVVGLVCPKAGLTHALIKEGDQWVLSQAQPDVYLPAKLEKVLTSNKRFIIVLGGRGSAKSVGVADICLIDAKDEGSKTYCLREYQSSIKNSVHSLLKEEIKRLEFDGFDTQQNSILCNGGEAFQFAGLARNVDSIKSAHGFKRFTIEESQFISEDSLTALTPTARNKPKKGLPGEAAEALEVDASVSMIFVANPGSSEDPFSQRFIVPFQDEIEANGFYEDDLHLIVKMNFDDNPWYGESGLEDERQWDLKNRERAAYDHIWGGAYNDSVQNSLIMAEWFDACIDAHNKLGFKAAGVHIAAHDPSDTGSDSKGFVVRHGSVITAVEEKTDGDINEGGDWATGLAIQHGVDAFTWDCDGMGVGLNRQVAKAFEGKNRQIAMFKGSESADFPDAIYEPSADTPVKDQKTNADVFRNKKAQYYWELRNRIYRTYRATVHGEYCDPDKMISFDSSIKLLSKLRAEVCRLPVKPNANGRLELYTKPEMASKFKIKSPNCFEAGTMIKTPTGSRPIEEIREGDRVLTPTGITKVFCTHRNIVDEVLHVELSSGETLKGTQSHRCFVDDVKSDKMSSLKHGSELVVFSWKKLILWKLVGLLFIGEKNLHYKEAASISSLTHRYSLKDFCTVMYGMRKKGR